MDSTDRGPSLTSDSRHAPVPFSAARRPLQPTADDARALMTEAFAVRVLDALEARPSPTIRSHDGSNLL